MKNELLKEAIGIFKDLMNIEVPKREWVDEMYGTLDAWCEDANKIINRESVYDITVDEYLEREDKL